MSTIVLLPSCSKTAEWSFWNALYVTERSLELTGIILYQISDFGKLTNESSTKTYRTVNSLLEGVDNVTNCLYCVDFIGSLSLIAQGKFFKRDDLLNTAARISHFITEILTPLYWLHDKGVVALGKCAEYIGVGISLFEGIGYTLSGISDLKTLIQTDDAKERYQAVVNLIWYALWILGKALEYLISPTHLSQAFITLISITRLSISLFDAVT